ncbi:hypothetical protein GCM10007100_01310 [Roseibacillus persicicus]|uniref:Uncharacterized protein n=1 Tax=Roseibacillus persicicus TaxID=454148 RepID=A0A918TBK9_9BACT|nr:hypothetical protein GCM10007100_01310 [Roseibacillus persicicus]
MLVSLTIDPFHSLPDLLGRRIGRDRTYAFSTELDQQRRIGGERNAIKILMGVEEPDDRQNRSGIGGCFPGQ